ncbi:MAG: cyclic nucleotide-binding domain-containing protein [Verrucomicrobiota bacterium]
MDFESVRNAIVENQYLRDLTDETQGMLLRYANLRTAEKGYAIYAEGQEMDSTFCLVLEGELTVQQGGAEIGVVEEWEIFGEVAFFTKTPTRSATVEIASDKAVWIKWKISRDELEGGKFEDLRRVLEAKTGATL